LNEERMLREVHKLEEGCGDSHKHEIIRHMSQKLYIGTGALFLFFITQIYLALQT
jgi:hypothetical protein